MWGLALHGGAGLIRRDSLSPEREAACRAAIDRLLHDARRRLDAGAAALEVVEAIVVGLEECELFNAGRGAVLGRDGGVTLDASIMDGRDRSAGAVTELRTTRNPIRLAAAVRHTEAVFLAGPAADAFAAQQGLEQVPNHWFVTAERQAQLDAMRPHGAIGLDHGSEAPDRYGTVGAVACDREGHLAAATSTGGLVNKRPGRVGDSPVIGAGTFAWDRTCAVSATGHGEPFLRLSVAARLSARIELAGQGLDEAAHSVIHADLPQVGGKGGLIAIDAHGAITMPFNTAGMFRGAVDATGRHTIAIW